MELGFAEAVSTGRQAISDGGLEDVRTWLSLSYTRLATLLHTNSRTLKRWMSEPDFAARMHDTTAARIGQFTVDMLEKVRDLARDKDVMATDLYPLSLLAGQLGRSVTSPSFAEACRTGRITCFDMGILGTYIPKSQVDELRMKK
jgi:hypothetical protein